MNYIFGWGKSVVWKENGGRTEVHSTASEETMIWACFTATGPQQLPVFETTVNSSVYQSTLKANMSLSYSESSVEMESRNRTPIQSTQTFRMANSHFTPTEWGNQKISLSPLRKTSMDWSKAANKKGLKFLYFVWGTDKDIQEMTVLAVKYGTASYWFIAVLYNFHIFSKQIITFCLLNKKNSEKNIKKVISCCSSEVVCICIILRPTTIRSFIYYTKHSIKNSTMGGGKFCTWLYVITSVLKLWLYFKES